MPPNRDWSCRPLNLVLALLVAMSAAVLSFGGLFGPFEDGLTASRAELLSRPPTGQTVIVEIDARSLAELRSWPWPRRYHAQVVRRLDEAGASIIAFDVDFSARSASGDQELASAIRDAGHVVLPVFQQRSSDRQDETRLLVTRPDAAFSSAWVGGVNIFPDGDGIVRDYPAATFIDGQVQPSIATLVAENDDLGARSFEPDWGIEARQIPRISFVDVMKGRVSSEAFRGKRVLIGGTAVELGDRYAVPRFGVLPGVVVQALAVESLLQDRAIQRTSPLVTIAGIFLIALLLSPRALTRAARYAALFGCLVASILAGPVLVQMLWAVSMDSAALLFTAVATCALQGIVELRRRLRLRALVDTDSGLPNRAALEHALSFVEEPAPVLVTAAIERFDAIRDGIGLAATNELIRNAAASVGALIGGPIYRIAPDVLAWSFPGGDEASVHRRLHQIDSAFRLPMSSRAGPVDVTFTLGLDRNIVGSAAVLRIERALSAIGTARSLGKPHAWYSGSDPQLRRQLSMMSDLRHAMEEGRLGLSYQPKMLLATGRIADAEALIRWYDGEGTIVSPDEFIPLAETTGVIREVTIFALRTAMADLKRWADDGISMRVSVNVSALDLATADFGREVDRLLAQSGVDPSLLTLEVTESALIRSAAEAISTLTALRDRGIRLAVDDYGTGQSTLSYLKHLPVHELKIDKSFVTGLSRNDSDAIMVRSTINLAHELGLDVVAEGIEDSATLTMLREMGCDYAQGYFIGRPASANELIRSVLDRSDGRRVA